MAATILLHLFVTTIAYGIAAGYSIAHRFWVGAAISVAAVGNEYLLFAVGERDPALLVQQPLTVGFAYFIVQAADRRGAQSA